MRRVVHCLKQISPVTMLIEMGCAGMFASIVVIAMLDINTPYNAVSTWSLKWLIPLVISGISILSGSYISSHMKKREAEDADPLFISVLRPASAALAVMMGVMFVEVSREALPISQRLAVLSFTGLVCVFCSFAFIGMVTKGVKSCCQCLKRPV